MQTASFIVSPSSTAQQVYDWLHGRILRGDLAPGARLSESEIAAQVGVSRQPVREAFIRLTALGLAEVIPQRGTFIGRISVKAVLSARMIREAVEGDLVRSVAVRPDDTILDALDLNLAAQSQAIADRNRTRFIELDDLFHRQIAIAAGHVEVWNLLEGMKSQLNRLRHLTAESTDQKQLVGQHRAIAGALRQGDSAKAEAQMRQHLRQIQNDLPAMQATHPDIFTD